MSGLFFSSTDSDSRRKWSSLYPGLPAEGCFTPAHRSWLEHYGWVVVEGVLTPAECSGFIARQLAFIESLGSGVRAEDPASWTAEAWPPNLGGILHDGPHSAVAWDARTHAAVRTVFVALYGVPIEELLVSFDRMNAAR
jgi:hypothetical protein